MPKYSKRNYRKALFVVRTIVEETRKVIGKGDSDGEEYTFLDQVCIYETTLKALTIATDFGLRPVERSEPENTGELPSVEEQEGPKG